MPTELQFRRYTKDELANLEVPLIGKLGEIFIDLDDNISKEFKIRIQDGITPGGIPLKIEYENVIGDITLNESLNTLIESKTDILDFESHYNGTDFKHNATHIDYTQEGIITISNASEAFDYIFDNAVFGAGVLLTDVDTQYISGPTSSILNLYPQVANGVSRISIGSTNYTATSGYVAELKLYKSSGESFSFVTDEDDETLKLITDAGDPIFRVNYDTEVLYYNDVEINNLASPSTNIGLILKSPNGTRWKITVNDSGNLITTQLP